MKWIEDRDPKSPGIYAVRMRPYNTVSSFAFAYFDGKGWRLPSQSSDDEVCAYRGRPNWSKIDWGTDEDEVAKR